MKFIEILCFYKIKDKKAARKITDSLRPCIQKSFGRCTCILYILQKLVHKSFYVFLQV